MYRVENVNGRGGVVKKRQKPVNVVEKWPLTKTASPKKREKTLLKSFVLVLAWLPKRPHFRQKEEFNRINESPLYTHLGGVVFLSYMTYYFRLLYSGVKKTMKILMSFNHTHYTLSVAIEVVQLFLPPCGSRHLCSPHGAG